MAETYHVPVMAEEILEFLDPKPGQIFVDATLGGGGHAVLIASLLGSDGLLIGIDQDPEAIDAASQTLASLPGGPRIAMAQTRFDFLKKTLDDLGVSQIDGILFDLGVSSHQLDEPARGFSFKDPAMPLDMRMNPLGGGETAADLLNTRSEQDLMRLFRDTADERWAARIAKFVLERRGGSKLVTVGDLIETVKAAVPAAARSKDIHPATRVFQALRIAVNEEFSVLERGLEQGIDALRIGSKARIAVLSYHSGEDRIVKRRFALRAGHCECPPSQPVCLCGAAQPALKIVTKKPLAPGADEVARNPRARSAKLRVAQKI